MSRDTQSGPEGLRDAACRGDRAALARVLSMVERGGPDARAIAAAMTRLAPTRAPSQASPAASYTVGITGAPGSGKSTLTNALLGVMRGRDERVAVLAVDPSSPYSGGAILGDRLRMGDHALDEGVFVRSMATRGHLGGLAVATPEAVRVLGAAGYPWVLVETVGVGQVEVEVAGHTDTTVVVVNPGWGDAVQAAKAGLMEIADIFVVNKADRPGAAEAQRDLERMLDMASIPEAAWRPLVVQATATSGAGVDAVWQAIIDHRRHLETSGQLAEQRRQRARDEIARMVAARLAERSREVTSGDQAAELAEALARGETDPWTAADELLGL
jgi:LAO/AO transport system kinase